MRSRAITAPTLCGVALAIAACGGGADEPERPQAPVRAEAKVRLGGSPIAVAVGLGAVWTADNARGTVTRSDPRTGARVGRPISVGAGPVAVAVGEGAVWVATGDGAVRRIDPSARRSLGPRIAVSPPNGLAVGGGGVWVTSRRAGTVTRVDARSGRISGTPTRVGAGAADIVVAFGSVWVANADAGTVSRLDPGTGRARGPAVRIAAEQVLGLAAGDGAMWAVRTDTERAERIGLVRLDVETGKAEGEAIAVRGGIPLDLAAGLGSVWVTDVGAIGARAGAVTRADAKSGRIAGRALRVGAQPSAVAVGRDTVWVTGAGDGSLTPLRVGR